MAWLGAIITALTVAGVAVGLLALIVGAVHDEPDEHENIDRGVG